MDKKNRIRTAVIAGSITIGLAYLYIFSPDIQLLKKHGSKNTLEASSITVRGRSEGRPSFEIHAEAVSSDRDQSLIDIKNIIDGTVFGKNVMILKELKAEHAVIQQYANIIEAEGNEKRPLTALINISAASGKNNGKKEFSFLKAESLRYHTNTKKGTIKGGILSNKRFKISGKSIEIDTANESALFYPSPWARTPSQTIRATTLESLYGQELLKGYGEAELKLDKGKTTVKADSLEFSTEDYNGHMEGKVRFSQKGKFATSDRFYYYDGIRIASLKGNVKMIIEKGGAVLKESTIEKIRNAETKKMLKEGILISCDSLSVSTKTGNASAEGKVELLQKKSRARSDKAYFDESKETVTMTGNVYVEKEGQWLKTRKVIASLSKEEFEAVGGVETLIKIKKKR